MIVILESLSLLTDSFNKEFYLSTKVPLTSADLKPSRLSYVLTPEVLVFTSRAGEK
jgi:hypothetical protein